LPDSLAGEIREGCKKILYGSSKRGDFEDKHPIVLGAESGVARFKGLAAVFIFDEKPVMLSQLVGPKVVGTIDCERAFAVVRISSVFLALVETLIGSQGSR